MSAVNVTMDGLSVMIGIPAGRDLHPKTVKSLWATQVDCFKMNIPCHLGMVSGSSVVQWARDEVVDLYLQTDSNRLFWIDSDMVWEPNDFIRLLAMSKLHEVVSAAYPAKNDTPTFYVNHDKGMGLVRGEYGLVEIWGIGLGFTVMRREVVNALAENAKWITDEASGKTMASIFRVDQENGKRRGEDMALFQDIRDLGYKVWLDPEIDLGHIGQKIYRGTIRDALK